MTQSLLLNATKRTGCSGVDPVTNQTHWEGGTFVAWNVTGNACIFGQTHSIPDGVFKNKNPKNFYGSFYQQTSEIQGNRTHKSHLTCVPVLIVIKWRQAGPRTRFTSDAALQYLWWNPVLLGKGTAQEAACLGWGLKSVKLLWRKNTNTRHLDIYFQPGTLELWTCKSILRRGKITGRPLHFHYLKTSVQNVPPFVVEVAIFEWRR